MPSSSAVKTDRQLLPFLVCLRLIASGPDLSALEAALDRIVRAARAEVGVSLIHVESGARFAIHGDQLFPMASVYKLPIALELLAQISEGRLSLDRQVAIGPSDIRACCTLSRRHPNGGVSLSAAELLELMMIDSDNTAADAVLKLVGGPAVVQRRLRALGFDAININRYEGDINFEMTGVLSPPPQEQWTLELQRRLIDEVPRAALLAARARAPGRRGVRDERPEGSVDAADDRAAGRSGIRVWHRQAAAAAGEAEGRVQRDARPPR
jgi:beta-lactamase class A